MDLDKGKPIEISDKALFDRYLLENPPYNSEFTFTNLFIWKDFYNFKFLEFDGHLLVFSNTYLKKWRKPLSDCKDCIFFLTPIGPNAKEMMIYLFKTLKNLEIHRVVDEDFKDIVEMEEFHALNLVYQEDRDNWDYVYRKEELINLAGNKYRQKRRWLNKFLEQYDYEFSLLSEDLLDNARKLQLEWCDQNECQSHEDLMEEQRAINNAFDYFTQLGVQGAILYVEGKPVGYTLGEPMNENMLVIHIEKAHANYEGSYQAINNFFLKNCCEDNNFVNREQDLGIPGLRRAKEAYKPEWLVEKSIIYKKS
jgi:hypothetical protein